MAKKKKEVEMPAAAPALKHVRLDLDPETHRLLRAVAGLHGVSMVAYVRELVERHLQEEAKRKGIRL